MLDAQELAKRVRAAMDLREPPLGSAELARKCGITRQSVYEWRTTGRMSKGHVATLAQETGMPLEFFLEAERGQSPQTRSIWRRLGKAFARAAIFLIFAASQYLLPNQAYAAQSAFNNNYFAQHLTGIHIVRYRTLRLSLRRAIARLVRSLTGKRHRLDNDLIPA